VAALEQGMPPHAAAADAPALGLPSGWLLPLVGGLLAAVTPTLIDAVAGVIVGGVVLLGVTLVQRLRGKH
jgi:predicted DNA repair protein MutK